mgnify:CR=1 FL=1
MASSIIKCLMIRLRCHWMFHFISFWCRLLDDWLAPTATYLIYVSPRLGYQRRCSQIPRKMLLIIFVTRQLILISRCAVFAQIMRNQIIGMYLLPDKSQQGRIANPAAPSDSSIIRRILIAMCDVFYFSPFAILLTLYCTIEVIKQFVQAWQ